MADDNEIEMPAEYVGAGHDSTGIPGLSSPVTSPEQTPATDAPNAALGPVTSVSAGGKAFSPAQYDVVQSKVQSPTDRRIAARTAPVDARYASDVATADRDYAGLSEAQKASASTESEFYKAQQELLAKRQAFEQSAAALEQRLDGEAKAQREEYLNAYREQLAGVRVLMAQSGNPLNNLSGAQAGGLALARFAEGFLAAGGIKIDVGSQVDRWVDRSIQEHQADIANARNLATDQLHLYEIARQSSQDDWESRQRYRGFVLQGLATSMEMNAARFQSQLATSRALEAAARLKIEADATERAIGDRHEMMVQNIYKEEYENAYRMGDLALKQQELKLKADALKAKETPNVRPYYDAATHKLFGVITDKTVNAEQRAKDADKENAAYKQWLPLQQKIIEAANAVPPPSSAGEKWWERNSPEARRLKALVTKAIQLNVYHDSGKAVTEQEFEMHQSQIPLESYWQSGNNKQIWGDYFENRRQQNEAIMQVATDPVEGFGAQESNRVSNPAGAAAYKINNLPAVENPPVKSVGAEEVKLAQNLAEGSRVSTEGGKFSQPGGFFDKPVGPEFVPSSKAYSTYSHDKQQPQWSVAVEHLALAAVSPKTFRDAAAQPHPEGTIGPVGEIPKDDTLLQQDGLAGLQRLANDKKHKQVASYAAHLLDLYESNPNELKQLIDPWAK